MLNIIDVSSLNNEWPIVCTQVVRTATASRTASASLPRAEWDHPSSADSTQDSTVSSTLFCYRYPTDLFKVLEPQNPLITKLHDVDKRQAMDIEALEWRQVPLGNNKKYFLA